jgi:hypothetical protein
MKKMMNISAGVFLGISIFLLPFISDRLQACLPPDNDNNTDPVTKQMDIKGFDKLIRGDLFISGVSMALFVGLAVCANKVKK